MPGENKDYSSISPSAKSLLMMKGYTDIPFAKEAATLMEGPEVFDLNFDEKDFWFWIRVMHFESRYKSIDQLLEQTGNTNVLELSSGFSFRGLDLCSNRTGIHYIDTDLAEVVAIKQKMITQLGLVGDTKSKFDLLPLNVLDEATFNATAERFSEGPVTVVNEGLLMYLDTGEKKRLCKTIHDLLKLRGGCWITADIYIKRPDDMRLAPPQSKSEAAFMQQHNIEENKFENYEEALTFFNNNGFELVQEATPNYQQLSILPQLLKVLPEEARASKNPPPNIQATWMLKAI